MSTTPTLTKVVRPEDKERHLCAFISAGILSAGTPTVRATMIAHSPDSPVARALASVAAIETGVTIELRVIFASLDVKGAAADLDRTEIVGMRRLLDVRLMDAHEQLTLNSSGTWIGDCLRRDPSQRDAFETFAPCDLEASRCATRSFDRLWMRAAPRTEPSPDASECEPGALGAVPAPGSASPSTALVATRH